jgi:hypothetical protein
MRQARYWTLATGKDAPLLNAPQNFFTMLVTSINQIQVLDQLRDQLHIDGCSRLYIFFKPNKVTTRCIHHGYNYGSRGSTLTEALELLTTKIAAGPQRGQ